MIERRPRKGGRGYLDQILFPCHGTHVCAKLQTKTRWGWKKQRRGLDNGAYVGRGDSWKAESASSILIVCQGVIFELGSDQKGGTGRETEQCIYEHETDRQRFFK